MKRDLLWVPAAALGGFATAAVFAGILRLPRGLYLIPYVGLTCLFFCAFMLHSGLSIAGLLRRNLIWGLVGAAVAGAFVVRNVLSQPASPRAEGLPLALDLLWSGAAYGLADALLLSVLPVLAVRQAFQAPGWSNRRPGRLLACAAALAASLLVTIAYHLGYPEYGAAAGIAGPVIGNGVMTLAYLLTGNPLAAILSHVAMHAAGVLHGPASVIQLPPHY